MTTLKISLSVVDRPARPNLPPGVRSMAKIMPAVLATHGLAVPVDPNSVRPTLVTDANDLFDVMLAGLESALAS